MKRLTTSILVTALMAVSAGAMADSKHGWQDRHEYAYDRREARQERREDRREARQERREDYRDYKQQQRAYYQGWRDGKRFVRGDRVPVQYRSSRYYVNDWRANRLYAPPQGYRWMKVNNDFLLVSIGNNLVFGIR